MAIGWESLKKRIASEGVRVLKNHKHGACIVNAHIVLNKDGDPVLWVIDPGKLVEPTSFDERTAMEILLSLTGSFSNLTE